MSDQRLQTDRYLAAGLNLASIFLPTLAPIVGFAIGHRSAYVRFHALRALLQEFALAALSVLLVVASVSWSAYSLYRTGFDLSHIDWVMMILKSVVIWLILAAIGVANSVRAVFDAVQGFRGALPLRYGRIERWAARLAGIQVTPSSANALSRP